MQAADPGSVARPGRRVVVTVPALGRRGSRVRGRLLTESRSQPRSQAERRLRALLHSAHFTGWKANRALRIDWGMLVDEPDRVAAFARQQRLL